MRTAAPERRPLSRAVISYKPSGGVDDFARRIARATPLELIALERAGVHGRFVKDLPVRLGIPPLRLFKMLGLKQAVVEKRAAAGEAIAGTAGQAALAVARLIAKAEEIVANSTARDAKDFDATKWLGRWLETPQPGLGGCRPSELIDTPTGAEVVFRLLGAMESGAYQ
jgi:putative toxin-antitoxin system antitoxin component (TIGR02293 family)